MPNRVRVEQIRRLLWQWGNTTWYVQRKERELFEFRAAIGYAQDTLKAQNVDGMPRGGNVSNPTERAAEEAIRREELYSEACVSIRRDIEKALRLKECVDEIIGEMEPKYQKILAMRYQDEYTWARIAVSVHYNPDWVRELERKAVETISERVEIDVNERPPFSPACFVV